MYQKGTIYLSRIFTRFVSKHADDTVKLEKRQNKELVEIMLKCNASPISSHESAGLK